jgi:hypothetical protein
MEVFTIEIRADDIPLDKGVIAELAGVNPETIPEPYNSIIQRELDQTVNYNNIRGGYVISENISLHPDEGIFKFNDLVFTAGSKIVNYLAGSEKLAFFACTAGEEVTLRSRHLMKTGYMVEGYIVDSIGSLLVEGAADIVMEKLKNEIGLQGLNITNRYSPGHCDWRLDQQRKLFSLFPEEFCGIRLSESSLMIPLKSLSGVIGIGANVNFRGFLCEECDLMNCIYRDIYILRGSSYPSK